MTPARAELVEFLAAARPDWPRHHIEQQLAAYQLAGLPFTVAVRDAVQLALVDDSEPADLRPRREALQLQTNRRRPA